MSYRAYYAYHLQHVGFSKSRRTDGAYATEENKLSMVVDLLQYLHSLVRY